jgi:CDP-4-dehydro-6-deoxyglucose reductase
MNHLLSLSQAARMVGVPRKVLQSHIQMGDLSVFEGSIRQSELLKIFPETNTDKSGMIEKVQRIQEDAVNKYMNDSMPDAEQLASEVQRLRASLKESEERVASYHALVTEMKDRMADYQSRCDKKQSLMISSLVGWFYSQCKLREKS